MSKTQHKNGFSLGDKVIFIGDRDPDKGVVSGQTGVVCDLEGTHLDSTVGVDWELENGKYHSCSGRCKEHHGWYVPYSQIAHLNLDLGEFEMSDKNLDILLGINI